MSENDAREKLYRIIRENGLIEYLEGKNILTCSLEEIKELKKKIAKRYHPDLNPNLSDKDIDTYKTINGLIATILKNKNSNLNSKNSTNYNQARRKEQDKDSHEFEELIKCIQSINTKFSQYKDFSILKEQINKIFKDFVRNRVRIKYYSTIAVDSELSGKIDSLFRNHFKKKLVENITSIFNSSPYYNTLKGYMDSKIEDSLTKMSLTKYYNYEEIQVKLKQQIYEKIAQLTTLTEKTREFNQKILSSSEEIKRTTEYQQIYNQFNAWIEKSKKVDKLEEEIHYIDELSKRYNDIQNRKKEAKTKRKNSSIYIPKKYTTRGEFSDGIRYLRENSNQDLLNRYMLYDIVRNIANSLPSIETKTRQELFSEYESLEDFLEEAEYIGRTIVFKKFGMTIRDIVNDTTYDFATLLYAKKSMDIGLYMKMNQNRKVFYFDKIEITSIFNEDDFLKGMIHTYRDKNRLIQDMEKYVAEQLIQMMEKDSYRFLYRKISNIDKDIKTGTKFDKELFDINNIEEKISNKRGK